MNITKIIENWRIAQNAGAVLPCPRCGCFNMKATLIENALSRHADIYICSNCGTSEALENMRSIKGFKTKEISQWWIATNILGIPSCTHDVDGDIEIFLNRKVYITKADIDDIMCTALEGGINYWCDKAEVLEDKYYGDYASDQISRGGSLKLYNSENQKSYILTLDKFLIGLSKACNFGYGNTWFYDDKIDPAMIDSISADIIIQCALFGEIIYS